MNGFKDPLNTWNQRFAQDGYLFGESPNHYLQQQASQLRPGRALAVADGEGRNGVWLAEQGLTVDAFDFSPVAIDKARALAKARGVQVNWVCSDWQGFDWQPEAWENTVAIFIQFADPATRATLFRQMKSALKPDGLILLQGYTPKQLEYKTGGPPLVEHLYTEDLLREAFGDMDISEMRFYDAVLHEGSQHSGQSAVIGMVARKPFGCNFQ